LEKSQRAGVLSTSWGRRGGDSNRLKEKCLVFVESKYLSGNVVLSAGGRAAFSTREQSRKRKPRRKEHSQQNLRQRPLGNCLLEVSRGREQRAQFVKKAGGEPRVLTELEQRVGGEAAAGKEVNDNCLEKRGSSSSDLGKKERGTEEFPEHL